MQSKVRNVSDIALLVRKLRHDKGLTQDKAAGLAGVGRRFLSELEGGDKDTLEIGKVLQVLNRLGVRIALETRDNEKN